MGGGWTRQARLSGRHDGDDNGEEEDEEDSNCGERKKKKTGQRDVGQSMMLTRPNCPPKGPSLESHGWAGLKPWMQGGGFLVLSLSSAFCDYQFTDYGVMLVLLHCLGLQIHRWLDSAIYKNIDCVLRICQRICFMHVEFVSGE